MKVDGLLLDNLQAAAANARRLGGQAVRGETRAYWTELLALARAERPYLSAADRAHADLLVARLEEALFKGSRGSREEPSQPPRIVSSRCDLFVRSPSSRSGE